MALISLIFGAGVTGTVTHANHIGSATELVMVLVIWVAIVAINVVYAVRR